MFDKLEVFRMAQGLATHAGTRQAVIARNVANADTPGYLTRDVRDFTETYRQAFRSMPLRTTRAGHLPAMDSSLVQPEVITGQGVGEPNGNTVSLEEEMMKAAEVKQKHDLALAIYRSSLQVLRTSIGRG